VQEQKLIRAVGLKEVIALTINGIIGAGIFALPASAGKILGVASPIAFVFAGLFACIIVLVFAELGGRYDQTGGAYLYAQKAYGGVFAFLIGWMYFLARLSSMAALCNGMIGFIGHFHEIHTQLRVAIILLTFSLIGGANYIGIRFSSRVIDFLTAAKLIPLLLFIIVGSFFVNWSVFSGVQFPQWSPLSETLLLAMFVFSGFEIIAVPGGEIISPQKTLPRGLLIGTIFTIVVYFLIQIVTVGTHPNLASAQSPLAEAASHYLGNGAGAVISIGAVISTLGTMISLVLVGPRILYAMALHRQMPQFLSRVHSRFRTPHVATVLVATVGAVITLTGTFEKLAKLSAMARLVTYAGSAIALLELRKKDPSPNTFRVAGGVVLPVLTILISALLLTAATGEQWKIGLIALGAGVVLYLFSFLARRQNDDAMDTR
jgi:amino acid transporter